ncbi:hypothetical protein BDF14DRAFT_1756361 [Spinellus fusiger]|nr:hypothetical protein BDF14DRAFT_1756361 [Spinellus fusiger]
MNPECDQEIFKERNKFDLVVYYDKKSEDMDQNDALKNLRRAIYEHEYSKKLRYMPMLLVGGLEAWTSTIGSRGLYQFETPTQEKEREASPRKSKDQYREHWLQDVVGKSVDNRNMKPVNLHHTLYDYFNHKQDGSSYQSMSQSNIPQPPLQGVFNQSSNSATYHSVPRKMPQPEYYGGHGHSNQPTKEPCYIRNHEIQPNQSSLPSAKGVVPYNSVLKRHNTFIDNPYYGFTSTTNKSFGAPPEPQRPKRPLPPVPQNHRTSTDYSMLNSSHRIVPGSKPPQLPMKPAGLTMAPPHATDQRQAPVSDSSLSQLGFTNNGTVGLKNLGNTCFMNSIIQCLMGTPPFVRYFTSGSFKQHINKKNKLGTGGVLAESFADLLGVMWNGSYTSVSPAPFRRELIKFAPQFSGTEQHDSQEFLNFLLDGIHEDVNMVTERRPATPENAADEEAFEKLKDWEASSIAWNKYLSRNSSVVVSLFQGQMRSRLKCMTCNKTSTTYNSFMSLSLPIPAKRSGPSSVSLLQCLDYFVKEEILEKEDAWFCPRCKALRRATKSLTLSRLPDVLLIHLKRFSFDGPFKDKLETIVKYPIKGLDLSGYIPNSLINPSENRPLLTYDLYGISNHYGSLTGGHYTACVRDGYRDQWHYFDDTRFSVCGEDKVNSRAAYNLFYVRSTVQ